ncbi:MAG: hypothetical protein IJN94_08050 [Clostridia bacterium]|nr:hypothetical protein [Clostridia bacterium]
MDENKATNSSNEIKIPAPPPVVPKKQPEKNVKEKKAKDKKPEGKKITEKNKKLLLLIPVIIVIIVVAIIVALALKNTDKSKNGNMDPVTITDNNGVPVTDASGEPVTMVPVIVTDANGQSVTDKKGEPVTMVPVVVTKPNGEAVTDPKGNPITVVPVPVTKPSGEPVTDNKGEPVTMVPVIVTDPSGDTVTESDGEPVTMVPVIVTDPSGELVTDKEGEPVTVVPETEVHEYTDENGEKETTIVYNDVTVNIPVTDDNGENVTDKNGEDVTEQIVITPPTTGNENGVVGTTAVPVTDGQGNTAVDNKGDVLTSIVEITSSPAVVEMADIEWKASSGGTKADYISSIATLKNGSYITSTVTNSTDGQFAKFKEREYVAPYTVLTKYSKNGDVVWQEAIGSKRGVTIITSIVPFDNGGFYAVGYGKDINDQRGKGYYDGAVFKFDKKGEQLWVSTFGTSTVDLFEAATLTSDGGVVAVGSVGNNDKDAAGFGKPRFESAAAIVKFNADGAVVWKDIIGGNKDSLTGVAESADGNIYCVGNFYTNEFFKNLGQADSCVLKYTSNGKYVEARSIAGSGNEIFSGITACKDGGIVVVGRSNSSDAGSTDSMFVSDLASRGGYDAYIIKYNADFGLAFAKVFRGQNNDDLTCVVETEDGSFIAAGSSNSSSRDLKGVTTRGGNDIVIASFNKYGDLSWARSFGGTKSESANAICLAEDGGYLVAGKTLSKDIDMKGIAQYVTDKTVGVIVKFPK